MVAQLRPAKLNNKWGLLDIHFTDMDHIAVQATHMLARRLDASSAQAAMMAGRGPGGCSRRCAKPAVRRMLRSSTPSAGGVGWCMPATQTHMVKYYAGQ